MGESIKNIKSRELSNSVLKQTLDNPKEKLTSFMNFVESYKYSGGGEYDYVPENMKILFDKMVDSNVSKENPSSKPEKIVEAYIIMNVIENKYDFKTIQEINCHYKDHEIATLYKKNKKKNAAEYWNMKLRKRYFSDTKYMEELQKRYAQTAPIANLSTLDLDKKNDELPNPPEK